MIIGIPKEIKENENRVAITPAGIKEFNKKGHQVLIQKNAGLGSGITDSDYTKLGASVIEKSKDIFEQADMIIKVKEPMPEEYPFIKSGQIIFTYFHLASSKSLTKTMISKHCICIAYETIETNDGNLPLLSPMSEVAGKMAGHIAAYYLALPYGGSGILMGGVPGIKPANVLIIGGGTVGTNAAIVSAGIGANVTILDINLKRLKYLNDIMPKNVNLLISNQYNIEKEIRNTDALIGATLITGAAAPKVVTEEMVKTMKPNSVIIDVAIDQGGCIETSKPTSHNRPVFKIHNVLHYCVANMPGAFPKTSTYALTNVTLPYALEIATKGYQKAIISNPEIAKGLNIIDGKITYKPVAEAFGFKYYPIEELYS